MNKPSFFKALWSFKFVLLIFTFLGFLIGYFVTDYICNQYFCYYEFNVETTDVISDVFSKDYFSKRVKEFNDYNTYVSTYNKSITNQDNKMSTITLSSGYSYDEIGSSAKVTDLGNNTYKIDILYSKFKTTFVSSKQTVSDGSSKCESNMKKLLTQSFKYYEEEGGVKKLTKTISPTYSVKIDTDLGFKVVNYNNPYLYAGVSASIVLVGILIALFILWKKKESFEIVDISDNKTIFRTPFHKEYWHLSIGCFKKVRDLCIISVLFAMMLACKLIPIPSGFGSLGIGITYLFFAVICMIYGPLAGLVIGCLSDVLGYFINSGGGVFFPGYTLDAMMAGFTYGICFYKTKVTFAKTLYARLFVNLVVNVIFGSLWYAIMYGLTFDAYITYVTIISLPKNLLYLLPQSILLFIVLKAVSRPLYAFGLMDERIKNNVSLF